VKLAIVLAVAALGACGKKSSSPRRDDAATQPTLSAPPAPKLPATDESASPPDAAIATHVTPPPVTSKFGHYCVRTSSGRSACVSTEEECLKLKSHCGQWKSVFCYTTLTGASCFTSREDCTAAHSEAAKAGEQLTSQCVQDEM
jgi:hypothetical protein